MSLKNNREDWQWFSLFDPKTGSIPGIEGVFTEDYQVDEVYTEAEDEDDDDEFDDYTEEEENELVYEDEEDED